MDLALPEDVKHNVASDDTYLISPMQPVPNSDIHTQSYVVSSTHPSCDAATIDSTPSLSSIGQNQIQILSPIEDASAYQLISQHQHIQQQQHQPPQPQQPLQPQQPPQQQQPQQPQQPQQNQQQQDQNQTEQHDQQEQQQPQEEQQLNSPVTRFKWTKEKTQVAMNLVKYGCKPKLVSVAVGCSLRTAQKYVETVTPKMEGESFKTYEIKRRGRKSKDVNQRLNAIREVLSKDSSKTQVEIAADLKVSNTTVCRDLKRLGASWKDKKNGRCVNGNFLSQSSNDQAAVTPSPQQTTRKTRQTNTKSRNANDKTNDPDKSTIKTRRRQRRDKTDDSNNTVLDSLVAGQGRD